MEQRTLPSVLTTGAESWPDKLALRSPTGSYTYAELLAATLRVAGGLEKYRVHRQEPVLAMLDNHLDFVVTFAGIAAAARMVVPVNTAYKGGILAHVVNDSGARVLVVEDRYCERLAAIAADLRCLSTVYVRGGDGAALKATGLSVFPFEELTTAAPAPPPPVAPSDLYGIVYTSGTTGPSKGVLVTHAGAYSHFHPAHVGATGPDDVNLVVLPMFHTAGQWAGVYNSLISGATAVVLESFHASTFWGDVQQFGCTYTVMVGAMANFLYRQPPSTADADNPLRQVTMVPVIPEVEDFRQRFQVEVGTCYGLSESSTPLIAPFGTARPKACGVLRPDFEARIVDEHDNEVTTGTTGELVLRPKEPWTASLGYHGRPEATAQLWRNLWLHTGDSLYQDESGQFYFADRVKDVIRRRGENVSSFEVETEINSHSAVLESAAVAVPSTDTEDDILAVVVLRDGELLDEEALIRHLADRLPYFMVPRYVTFAEALPRTPSQKIKKQELREVVGRGPKWDREEAGVAVPRR